VFDSFGLAQANKHDGKASSGKCWNKAETDATEASPTPVVTETLLQNAINDVLKASDLMITFAMPAAVKRYTMTDTVLTSITRPPASASTSGGATVVGTRAAIKRHAAPQHESLSAQFNMSTILPESENRWVVLEFKDPDHAFWARLALTQAVTLDCAPCSTESAQEWLELKTATQQPATEGAATPAAAERTAAERSAAADAWKKEKSVVRLANLVRYGETEPAPMRIKEQPPCAKCLALQFAKAAREVKAAKAATAAAVAAAKQQLEPACSQSWLSMSPSSRHLFKRSVSVVCEHALPEYKRCAARPVHAELLLFLTHVACHTMLPPSSRSVVRVDQSSGLLAKESARLAWLSKWCTPPVKTGAK
jgi:hypothetical protein